MFKKKMAVAVAADVPVSTVSDPGKTEQFSVWNCIKGYLYIPFAILFICVFFTKVVLLAFIPTSSMVPTLQKGDFLICNRLVSPANLERGDIIVFHSNDQGMELTKRIIGLPGETLTVKNGGVYINGELLDESEYLDSSVITAGDGEWTIPEDAFFTMGDNREYSDDSRFWAAPFVHFSDVMGPRFLQIHIPVISDFLGSNPY